MKFLKHFYRQPLAAIKDTGTQIKNLYTQGTKELNPITGKPNTGLGKVYSGLNGIYKNLSADAQDAVIAGSKAALPLGGLAYMTGDTGLDGITSAGATLVGSTSGSMLGNTLANSLKAGPARGKTGSLLRALLTVAGATAGGGSGLLASQLIKGASVHKSFNKQAFTDWLAEEAYDTARKKGADIPAALLAAGTSKTYGTVGALTGANFGGLLGATLHKKLRPGKSFLPGLLLGLLPGAALGGAGGINLGARIARKSQENLPAHIKDLGYRPVQSIRTANRLPEIVG